MSKDFNLPGSSFDEVSKIIRGYSHASENSSLDTISKLTGLHTTVISRNNKFLADINLIAGGLKKSATETCKKLGRALEHKQTDDFRRYWREAVQSNEKVAGLVTTVRIKSGMSEKDFSDHVLYVSGQKKTSGNKTGARCVVDVLVAAGLLKEGDGKLTIAAPAADAVPTHANSNEPAAASPPSVLSLQNESLPQLPPVAPAFHLAAASMPVPQIAINIQLHLPETENAEIYEKLFRALREQLLTPKD